MDAGALYRHVHRDRSAVERRKRTHWIRVYREQGPESTWRAGHALYDHARRVRPDYPTARDRASDLAHHVRLKELLDRASRAITLR